MAIKMFLITTFMLVLASQLVAAQYRAYPQVCRNWYLDISDMDEMRSKRPRERIVARSDPNIIVAGNVKSRPVMELTDVNQPNDEDVITPRPPNDKYHETNKKVDHYWLECNPNNPYTSNCNI